VPVSLSPGDRTVVRDGGAAWAHRLDVVLVMSRKVDTIQRPLVTLLEAHGATFQSMAAVGRGCPDGIVGFLGETAVVEFKSGARAAKRKSKTADQQAEWRRKWKGSMCWVVTSWPDCERMLESMRRRARLNGAWAERYYDGECR
jgi:hypothetical protein